MAGQVDSLDEQILASLQANGRMTMKALAESVGLSSPAMIERVRRLEERGVLAGYRAVIAPAALGRPVTALITATLQREAYETFLDRVKQDEAVVECHRITGDATFQLKAHLPDLASLEQLVDDLSATGARCETALVLSSPVSYRSITPPAGMTAQRTRVTRRRRGTATRAAAPEPAAPGEAPRRGRPRGRRRTAE
jgi:Lrp/AsnC family leucine-responsive transcriptional regulator